MKPEYLHNKVRELTDKVEALQKQNEELIALKNNFEIARAKFKKDLSEVLASVKEKNQVNIKEFIIEIMNESIGKIELDIKGWTKGQIRLFTKELNDVVDRLVDSVNNEIEMQLNLVAIMKLKGIISDEDLKEANRQLNSAMNKEHVKDQFIDAKKWHMKVSGKLKQEMFFGENSK